MNLRNDGQNIRTHGSLAQRIIRYYFALRMSASTAAPELLDVQALRDPAPVVRLAPARTGEWDERECINVRGQPAAFTVPLSASSARRGSAFSLN